METVENKYITVAYKLYAIEDGEKDFTEEATAEHPFQFISGLGLTLESFEDQVKQVTSLISQSLAQMLTVTLTKNM